MRVHLNAVETDKQFVKWTTREGNWLYFQNHRNKSILDWLSNDLLFALQLNDVVAPGSFAKFSEFPLTNETEKKKFAKHEKKTKKSRYRRRF